MKGTRAEYGYQINGGCPEKITVGVLLIWLLHFPLSIYGKCDIIKQISYDEFQ